MLQGLSLDKIGPLAIIIELGINKQTAGCATKTSIT